MLIYFIYFLSSIFFFFLGLSFEERFCELIRSEESCYADPSGGFLAVGLLITGLYLFFALPGIVAIYLRYVEKSINTACFYSITIIGSFLLCAIFNGFIWPRYTEPKEIVETLAGIRFGIIIISNLLGVFIASRINAFRLRCAD